MSEQRIPLTGDEVLHKIMVTFFILIGVIVLSFSSCEMHNDYRIGLAIDKGVNPLDAQCAFSNGLGSTCAIRATK